MSAFRILLPLLTTVVASHAFTVPVAQAGGPIRRCTGPEGVSVFTDKPCHLVQAQPRLPASPRSSGTPGSPASGRAALGARSGWHCPQRLSQLVDEIQLSIQSGDINRLSALYWWGGMGNAQASRLLERLETMVERPLVDIAPVYPSVPAGETGSQGEWIELPPAPTAAGSNDPGWMDPGSVLQAPPRRPRPYALRIEQILANGTTPAREIVHLRRQYGCFWISF